MAPKKRKGSELSVFRGRQARLNRSMFQALSAQEPQTTRELHKKTTRAKGLRNTSYSTVNKRVRSLEESGYLRKAAVKERPGGITNYYELTSKAHLALFFDSTNIEDLLIKTNDKAAAAIVETLVLATTYPDIFDS